MTARLAAFVASERYATLAGRALTARSILQPLLVREGEVIRPVYRLTAKGHFALSDLIGGA